MNFNLREVPFSRFGSFLAFSILKNTDTNKDELFIRNINGDTYSKDKVFKIDLIKDGKILDFQVTASPTKLALYCDSGFVEIIIVNETLIRFRGKGVGIKLTVASGSYDYLLKESEYQYKLNYASHNTWFAIKCINGTMTAIAPWAEIKCPFIEMFFNLNKSNIVEGFIEQFQCTYKEPLNLPSFDDACREVENEFYSWLNVSPSPAKEEFKYGAKLASYITWSSVVPPKGYLTRNAMYMSKNWMDSIWSWDYCFNAMALAKSNPELCFDQFMIFIDNQQECGTYADLINPSTCLWSFCKPPIQGWALKWIMERSDFLDNEKLTILYNSLCNLTKWWFKNRDLNGNGIPEYNHGNDCGWDNSTIFHKGIPVESPDLCTFLVLQMELLSDIAEKLKKPLEASKWLEWSGLLLDRLITYFWKGDRFTSYLTNGEESCVGDSLILFMPILLGKRLPEEIRNILISGLKEKNRFSTKNGLATESTSSPYYKCDGYWRGPIWAPSTMLLIDGLMQCGEEEFASDLANRFCSMANVAGMAENFDAITGEALRDKSFTWTSSVFLILANEYCKN